MWPSLIVDWNWRSKESLQLLSFLSINILYIYIRSGQGIPACTFFIIEIATQVTQAGIKVLALYMYDLNREHSLEILQNSCIVSYIAVQGED